MSLNLDRKTWSRVRLGDVVKQSKESVDPTDGSVDRYVAGGHMDTDDLKIERWGDVNDGYLGPAFHRRFRPGHVLYGSRRTYLRKLAVAEFDGVCANTTLVLEPKNSQTLLARFLPFIMTAEVFHAFSISESKGSVNPYVNWSDIARYEFDLPPIDQQQRIADLLWAVEATTQSHEEVVASLRDLSQGKTAAEMLALNEDETFVVPDVVDDMSVGIVVRPTQYYTESEDGIPALRSLNVLPNDFDLTNLVRFKPKSHARLTKTTLRLGDVVIVRTGRPGDAAVVDESTQGFNCIDLIIVRSGPKLDAHYFVRVLNSEYGRALVLKHSAGTAQQHFNVGALKRFTLPVPSLPKQRAIVRDLETIDLAVLTAVSAVAKCRVLSGSITSDIFGGTR